ncbi:metallophosphoesterase [Virgibacillus sp. SK37]|uniref:metallophosphoesterase n=1 Tax=Virgibacillus sp. SK37 TaxID=403957 RepID=UPI0005956E6A|nr:metallophosphoesterase [Virgibacillus sp. SK37]
MIYIATLFALGAILICYMLFLAHHDHVRYQTIKDERLPANFNGFKIFFISDIHRRSIRTTTLQTISSQINIIVIGGDLTEKGVPLNRVRNNIRKLKNMHAPIYFIWGNNDYEASPEKIKRILEQEDVHILLNTNKDLRRGDQIISLLGIDCCKYGNVNVELPMNESKGVYKLLITHDPSTYMGLDNKEKDMIHIVLAGHTHGGQIRIFGKGPYERGKLSKIRDTNVLISEGYGYTTLPFRLGTNAECHIIQLERN